MRSVLCAVIVAGLVAAGAGAAAYVSQHGQRSGDRASVSTPRPPLVMALGRVEPVSRVIRLSGPSGTAGSGVARIASIHVLEGERVEAGQLVAVLDTRPGLEAALAQAESQLGSKLAVLAKTAADLDHQENSHSAALVQQEAERDRVKWDFEKMQRLQAAGLYTTAALTDKRLALEAANRRAETARLLLERTRVRDSSGVRVDEATARADVMAARAALAKAQADLDQAFIRAPVAGRILRVIGRLGEQIGTDGLAELADTSVMMVRAELFEADVRFAAVGQVVEATSRSIDGALHGRVDRVGLRLGQQSIIKEDPAAVLDARVVEVMVRLDPESSRRVEGLSNLQVRVTMERTAPVLDQTPVASEQPKGRHRQVGHNVR